MTRVPSATVGEATREQQRSHEREHRLRLDVDPDLALSARVRHFGRRQEAALGPVSLDAERFELHGSASVATPADRATDTDRFVATTAEVITMPR